MKLADIAQVVRSKNAGPRRLTLDLMFATDADYAKKIAYWTTPTKDCVDGKGTDCTSYTDWVNAWQQIRG